jgi:hypothetical protein
MHLVKLNIWEEGMEKRSKGQHEFRHSLLQIIAGIRDRELISGH